LSLNNIPSHGISAINGATNWINNFMYIMHYGHTWMVMFCLLYHKIWRN